MNAGPVIALRQRNAVQEFSDKQANLRGRNTLSNHVRIDTQTERYP
jgi:hypothetical protein